MDREELARIMRSLVADSLARKPDAVRLESRLITDLGADSLDFIDLLFTIEQRFGVKFEGSDLDFLTRLDLTSPQALRNGYLTKEAVEKARDWLPALKDVPDPAKVTPAQLFSMVTVETLCSLVERRLGSR